MGDLSDWIQSRWYELGSLGLQVAILAVIVSYGRKALRILSVPLAASRAASQAQVELLEDLQKLSETRGSRPAGEPAAAYGGVGRMLSADRLAPAVSPEPAAYRHRGSSDPWGAITEWLQTPMGHHPAGPWRRVIRHVS
jgi:hypothetical protein